jgi:hypothetical protein
MALPIDVVVGVYLGLLSGIIPALVAFGLGFLFKYVTGVTIPGVGVIVVSLAVAGVNGGLLALTDPSVVRAANAPVLVTALVVVLMLSLFAHNRGDALGTTLPKRVTLRSLRERTLSADVVEFVGGRGQVRVEVVGEVTDVEGMPPLPDDVRAAVRGSEWVFAADLPLDELERQLEERLRAAHDLSEVSAEVDSEGRASVSAAPPVADVSKRVPRDRRAVSVAALVPTGVARGDLVTLRAGETAVTGPVVSASSGGDDALATDGGAPEPPARAARAPTTTGGDGRVTVAVEPSDLQAAMRIRAGEALAVVEPRGVRREYELLSLLRRGGHHFRRVEVAGDSPLATRGATVADLRADHAVAVVAVRGAGGLTIAPPRDRRVEAGDALYLVGTRADLAAVPGPGGDR